MKYFTGKRKKIGRNKLDTRIIRILRKLFSLPILTSFLLGLLLVAPVAVHAQFSLPIPGIPKIPGTPEIPVEFPGLDNLLKKEPPITTSFADARNQLFLPDDFGSNQQYTPLTQLERGSHGGFLLRPGFYELVLQSYCLHAGTHGPSQGEGYLNAPLKGPKKTIVQNILRNSVRHPDIAQQDIQVLIWAILARTKFSDLQPRLQQVAAQLLTVKEIVELNGGALGLIPPAVLQRVSVKLPSPVRQVLEAENKLRQTLTQGGGTFNQLERIAVLAGEPPDGEKGPTIPRGRWSDHPGGYYVRYFPSGYSRTRIQIYVPDKLRDVEEYDPSGDVAVPSNTSRQRLAQSARSVDNRGT
jgi:hypothetical protein